MAENLWKMDDEEMRKKQFLISPTVDPFASPHPVKQL